MALVASIAGFKTGDYTVTRVGKGAAAGGRYTSGAETTLSIEASIQPVSGRDLKTLPEGRRAEEVRVVYTVTELRTLNPAGDGDVVTYGGEPWEVFRVERWPDLAGGEFTRAMIARQPTGGAR